MLHPRDIHAEQPEQRRIHQAPVTIALDAGENPIEQWIGSRVDAHDDLAAVEVEAEVVQLAELIANRPVDDDHPAASTDHGHCGDRTDVRTRPETAPTIGVGVPMEHGNAPWQGTGEAGEQTAHIGASHG